MQLTIKQRVILLNMSAAFTGNVVALGKIQKFRDELSISSEEEKVVNFRMVEDVGYKWTEPDEKHPLLKEIDVPERAMTLVAKSLTEMDKSESLTLDMVDIYELFIPDDSENGNHPGQEIAEKVEA